MHHKHRAGLPHPTQQVQQVQHGAGAANGSASPAVAAGAHASTAAGTPAQALPMRKQGVTQGPASHPLTLQQIEQSMEFSTSSSSNAGAATAPIQAVSKGRSR